MDREPVISSNLVSVGYSPESETLEVEFKGGTVYQYYNVPAVVHEQLMSAPSHGEYFAAHIRNTYPYARL